MNEKNDIATDEAALQSAWEQVLRGEIVSSDTIDLVNRETAETLRSYMHWETVADETAEVNELDRQRLWEQLAPQILPAADDSITLKNKNKLLSMTGSWLTGLVVFLSIVGIVFGLIAARSGTKFFRWGVSVGAVGGAGTVIASSEGSSTREEGTRRGGATFKRIKVDNLNQLLNDLVDADFSFGTFPEYLNDKNYYLIRIKAVKKTTAQMKLVLDQYDIVFEGKKDVLLYIKK